MTRVIVTGGAGFIGSHLTEKLIQTKHSVIVIDNFSTGKKENLASVISDPKLTIIEADINNGARIRPLFRGVDVVYHLAALADIVPSIKRPIDYFQANVSGTVQTLEASRVSGVKRFIYTASSSCYGIPSIYPTPECADINPQYPYALTKRLGEECVQHWATVYQLPAVSLRLFNVYGPRARTAGTYGAVFGVFLAQKLAKQPFTVVGDGTQTRDFTYVTDVVDAFLKAAESNLSLETFNVGSGNTYSINRLIELLGGDVVRVPKRPGEPDCTFAEISKIKQMLNWKPQVSFKDGVKMMLQHIDDWRSAPVWNEHSIADATKEWFTHLGEKLTPVKT